jgi:SAM-dependent methyltransferase
VRHLHPITRLRRSFRERGLAGSFRHYAVRIYRIFRPHRLKPHPFDVRHGVHTTDYIAGSDLGTGHPHDIYNTAYYGSSPSMLHSAIEAWRGSLAPTDPPIEAYTFLDLGAGMGRAVMVASLYPFHQVIGIEMSPRLAAQARRNLAIWTRTPRSCNLLQIATCDGTEFPWPRAPLAIYMFNPFEEPVVLRLLATLEHALAEGSGPIDILYMHPTSASVFEAHPHVQFVASTLCHLSDEDRAVDLFSDPESDSSWAECRLYRLV